MPHNKGIQPATKGSIDAAKKRSISPSEWQTKQCPVLYKCNSTYVPVLVPLGHVSLRAAQSQIFTGICPRYQTLSCSAPCAHLTLLAPFLAGGCKRQAMASD